MQHGQEAQGFPPSLATGWSGSGVVHQATGMIMVQMSSDISGAFAALRARAFAEDRSLHEVAADVIERRTRFGPEAT